jgi:hypothetical protein
MEKKMNSYALVLVDDKNESCAWDSIDIEDVIELLNTHNITDTRKFQLFYDGDLILKENFKYHLVFEAPVQPKRWFAK